MVTRRHRPRKQRWISVPLLLIVALLTLSACVDVELGSEYRSDGSASHTIQIRIEFVPADREDVEDMNAVLADLEERTINSGLEFERSDESGVVSIRISGTTSEGQEAGAALNSLLNATGINASPGVTAPFRGTFQRETGAIGGSSYTLDLSVDGEMLFESVVIDRLSSNDQTSRSAVNMVYIATFPGDVTRTTGEKIADDTVRWEIPFTGVTDLSATSRTGGPGSIALFVVGGVAVAIIILIIAVALGWYLARRNRLSMTLRGGIHRIPGQQTITREGIWVARKVNNLTHRFHRDRSGPPEN